MQKFTKNSIGTTLEITFRTENNLSPLFREIDIFLENFEKKFSRFIPNNWLFDLNKNKTAILDDTAFTMLDMMQKIAHESGGFFDPTIGKRLRELGYGNQEIFFSPEAFNHRDFDEIISFDREKIFLKNSVEIEFGGIGKGFLIDWIFVKISQHLDKNIDFLINFGGDMASRGKWKIALESPFVEGEAIGLFNLENTFLACSAGNKRKFWQHSHHLINPFTGHSADDVVAVFISTPTTTPNGGMLTDGFATAFSVMNFEKSCEKLTKNSYLEGVIIEKNGKFFKTNASNMELF